VQFVFILWGDKESRNVVAHKMQCGNFIFSVFRHALVKASPTCVCHYDVMQRSSS